MIQLRVIQVLSHLLTLVNYGVLLLRALLEHWPESHTIPVQEEASPEDTTDIGMWLLLFLPRF